MTPRRPKDARRAPDLVTAPPATAPPATAPPATAPPATTPPGRRPTRPAQSGSRRAAEQEEVGRRSARRKRALIAASVAVVLVALVAVAIVALTGRAGGPTGPAAGGTGTRSALGPEGIPLETGTLLAPAATSATGQTVDGIQCDASEQVAYHVHTHLSVYVNGRLRPLPAGVGIVEPEAEPSPAGAFYGASHCYYWLHVHAQDGVVHIESPTSATSATYTLGQFFDIWGQPLGVDRVGPATGALTVFVDGKRFRGDPRSITLGSHRVIQIDVGSPAPSPKGLDWSRSRL